MVEARGCNSPSTDRKALSCILGKSIDCWYPLLICTSCFVFLANGYGDMVIELDGGAGFVFLVDGNGGMDVELDDEHWTWFVFWRMVMVARTWRALEG